MVVNRAGVGSWSPTMSKLFYKLVLLASASLVWVVPAAATDLLPYGNGYPPPGADLLPYENGYAPEGADLVPHENGYLPQWYGSPRAIDRYQDLTYERPNAPLPGNGYSAYGRPSYRDFTRYCEPDGWAVANGYIPPAWCFPEGAERAQAPLGVAPHHSYHQGYAAPYPIRGYAYR
jgi:hypothetical protein